MITPDRTLARRVAATLARWDIRPDDSAGVPLSLTPAGRFMRHVGQLIGTSPHSEHVITLLKHPRTRTGAEDRGAHLVFTRQLELFLRDNNVPVITNGVLTRFAHQAPEKLAEWVAWVKELLGRLATLPAPTLAANLTHHVDLAEAIAQGPGKGAGTLWQESSGRAVLALIDTFRAEESHDGPVAFQDYFRLFEQALSSEEDRDPRSPRPDVMIWGTLEARVQGADLVIIGAMNEGHWPEMPAADPWLNRRMRRDLGLLLPERETGLAAHDFQQAVAAPNVILTRAKRADDGETVPSRWLNRLGNLMNGLPLQNGPQAIKDMRGRGQRYLDLAQGLDRPDRQENAASRPAPSPPANMRPKRLSVTEIKTLIRDPYAIYAKHVLRLKPIAPLHPKPDARLKGIVFHDIIDAFYQGSPDLSDPAALRQRLFELADLAFQTSVPWHSARLQWRGHLEAISDWLISSEQDRRREGALAHAEIKGALMVRPAGVEIVGKADRIDRLHTGDLVIYDYKTGQVPSKKAVRYFDRQLLIEAVMAEQGGFEGLEPGQVAKVAYLDIGRTPETAEIPIVDDYETVTVSRELAALLASYNCESTGYASRRAMEKERFEGYYDHLARFGEWDASKSAKVEPVK